MRDILLTILFLALLAGILVLIRIEQDPQVVVVECEKQTQIQPEGSIAYTIQEPTTDYLVETKATTDFPYIIEITPDSGGRYHITNTQTGETLPTISSL